MTHFVLCTTLHPPQPVTATRRRYTPNGPHPLPTGVYRSPLKIFRVKKYHVAQSELEKLRG